MKITVETIVNAPISKVWSAYTTPDDIKQWNTASDDWHTTQSTVDLREGGAFSSRMEAKDGSFGFDFAGTYTKIVPQKLIEYSFGDRTGAVEFLPGANGVTVRSTFDAETQNPIEQQRQGWQAILNNFAKHVEAMVDLILTTFDWVPETPRGYVRDIRVRWALEEAGLPYRVESVPFRARNAEHFAHQPFGQVPWLTDGDISIFESGAILLHLGERSDTLMPADPRVQSKVKEWIFAALNSVEMASLPFSLFKFTGDTIETPGRKRFDQFLKARLQHMEAVLSGREWLTGKFSVADILMADVLRLVDRFDGLTEFPACRAYVARATARPSFVKAHADQMAHFAAAD